MVRLEHVNQSLLSKPSGSAPFRPPERAVSNYHPLTTFHLAKDRSYQQQFADLYFLRLTHIKPAVEEIAAAAWDGVIIGGETAKQVERVLDVRQGELCWVAGSVYMDMPMKPNVLEDVSKDRWISAPSTTQRYYSDEAEDAVMLEDDSGRVRLVGDALKSVVLVTGCVIAVMGTENADGEFQVINLKLPDLAPQPERWLLSAPEGRGQYVEIPDSISNNKKLALVSGLEFSGTSSSHALELDLLLEYLLGEATHQPEEISRISRLIIAGNSIAAPDYKPTAEEWPDNKTKYHKKYGYDSSTYKALPAQHFDTFLSEILPSLPVTLLPGPLDPANASYPQQPIHTAMFPKARVYAPSPQVAADQPGWFDPVTNPWEAEVEGWRVLGTGGQNLDDMFKYVDSCDGLGLAEATCRWRCTAPTAPDTLWAYPFQDDDPFVMKACPHLYFIGCQPSFGTRVIQGPAGQRVRLVLVPSFSATREVVLVDTETLEVSIVRIAAPGPVTA